jgi:hypothetical protein
MQSLRSSMLPSFGFHVPPVACARAVLAATVVGLLGILIAPAPAASQMASVVVSNLPCLPVEGNAAIYAAVSPPDLATTVRVFFRRQDHGDMYYVTMNPLGGGNYWAVLPKPERQNEVVEYHVTALDAAGAVLNSSEVQRTTVIRDCETKLAQIEEDASETLTIGETTSHQKGRPVAWFLCDGILSRVDTRGEKRADEFCSVPPPPIPIIDRGVVLRLRPPASPSVP